MKKRLKVLMMILIFALFTGCKDIFTVENKHEEYLKGKHYVEMKIKDYGTMEIELDADVAPITVTNFINLVKDGFYDGLPIHRVQKDFVIQGGASYDILNEKTIKGEFDANGVSNDISHERGVISMARTGDLTSGFDSASTQFFIVLKDNPSLDHYYAGFGHVTKGMDVADKMASKITNVDEMGFIKDENKMPIIEYIKEIEK